MFAELLFIAATLAANAPAPASGLSGMRTLAQALSAPAPAYVADARAVSNWRREAAASLAIDTDTAAAFARGEDPRGVARCVKLNNYWCIKGIGWNGMLGAAAEGHAAFASAEEGAAVAALLLRRYYLDFSRRSAQAIVSRWAPAQCGGLAAPVRSPVRTTQLGKGFRLAQTRMALGPAPGLRQTTLATRGLGNTLRARFLAARGGRVGKPARGLRKSVIADRPPPPLRAPQIAAGLGGIDLALAPKPSPLLASIDARVRAALAAPALATAAPALPCVADGARIRNYAAKVIEGVANAPDEDLKLFEADGAPTARLERVMLNMASVEIGPLAADPALVRSGIAIATAALRAAREATAAVEAEAAPGR